MVDLNEIAYKEGLNVVETTTKANGYPCNLKHALIGFVNFEQIQEVADKYGLVIREIFRKDGHQLYTRTTGACCEPFSITADDYGDNYRQYTREDYDNFFEDEVKPRLEDFNDFHSLEEFIDDMKDIQDELSTICTNERLIVDAYNNIIATVSDDMIDYEIDGTRHWIALLEE